MRSHRLRNVLVATASPFLLDVTQVEAVAAFLRVVNALDNSRTTVELLDSSLGARPSERVSRLLRRAARETEDDDDVLAERMIHPDAVSRLRRAESLIQSEARSLLVEG